QGQGIVLRPLAILSVAGGALLHVDLCPGQAIRRGRMRSEYTDQGRQGPEQVVSHLHDIGKQMLIDGEVGTISGGVTVHYNKPSISGKVLNNPRLYCDGT